MPHVTRVPRRWIYCMVLMCFLSNTAESEQVQYSREQYERLVRCSRKEAISEWNRWQASNPAEGIRLQGAELADMKLDGCNLTEANLRGATLYKARLNQAQLTGAILDGADISEAQLSRAHLMGASLREITGDGVHFDRADLTDANLAGVRIQSGYFDSALLKRSNLAGAELENARMRSVRLIDADLSSTLLARATLINAQIRGSDFSSSYMNGADLTNATVTETEMKGANLEFTELSGVVFRYSDLRGANLAGSVQRATVFFGTDLRGADFRMAMVDGFTRFVECKFDEHTDFRGVGLDSACIPESDQIFLERNIRKLNWEDWYKRHPWKAPFVQFFWWISDYGYSTWRIALSFFVAAALFALIYYFWARLSPPGIICEQEGLDQQLPRWRRCLIRFIRPFYFSVVTMTTLGFGDIRANPATIWGHVLVTIQVILGYFLLGALITRLGILFTSGGPGF